jgi:ABC-type phosphate transport system substrate-binding protein
MRSWSFYSLNVRSIIKFTTMPEGETTTQHQLESKINEAIACLQNAKDSTTREVFSRELFDACVTDASSKITELASIE